MCANFSEFSKHLMPKQTYLLPAAAVVAAVVAVVLLLLLPLPFTQFCGFNCQNSSKPIKCIAVSPPPTRPGRVSSVNYDNAFREAPLTKKKEWKLAIRPVRDMDPPMLLLLGAVHVNNCCKKANRKQKQKRDFSKMFLHKFCGKRLESIFVCVVQENTNIKYQTKLVN